MADLTPHVSAHQDILKESKPKQTLSEFDTMQRQNPLQSHTAARFMLWDRIWELINQQRTAMTLTACTPTALGDQRGLK